MGQWTMHLSRGDKCSMCVHHFLLSHLPTEFAILHEHKMLVGSQYMEVHQDSEQVSMSHLTLSKQGH